MADNNIIRDIIRSKIKCFINRRKRAYDSIVNAGYAVPDYAHKNRTIEALRIQLQASESWDLKAHLNWIHAMHDDITALLPYEFHDDPKQILYRKHMVDLLRYCEDLLNSKPLFQLK
jgi:hypothetical protein